jgi:calcium-independent phospholipase A2-gamma
MKGLVLVELLDKIEKLTGKRIYELFDLICGTSTGGIVALAVGGLKKDLKRTDKVH